MNAPTFRRERRSNRFFGAAALLLLLLAFTDLAFPAFCNEDNERVGNLIQQDAGVNLSDAGPSSHDTAPHVPVADDCFCCCSHIIGSSSESLAQSTLTTPSLNERAASQPLGLVLPFFHPPRIA